MLPNGPGVKSLFMTAGSWVIAASLANPQCPSLSTNAMSPLESLTIAFRSLRVNKLRSALTALGIIVGVAAVVCMISVGAGARAEVAEKIRTLGTNLLVVMP